MPLMRQWSRTFLLQGGGLFFSGADPEHLPQRSQTGYCRDGGDSRHYQQDCFPGGIERREQGDKDENRCDQIPQLQIYSTDILFHSGLPD
jgi:hypothetical protein